MQYRAITDPEIETDFYLESSARRPLLTAQEEIQLDRRKWAAARRCLRLLLRDDKGAELVSDFCRACEEQPPHVEDFEPRSLYFTLRKEIVNVDGQWPATLMIGLAIIHLRRCGRARPDILADALCTWQPAWKQRYSAPASPIASLGHAIEAYMRARDTLVLHNLRLVHKLVWDMPDKGIPRSDLVQDGIIGLVRAAEKFDYRRGYRFTTYAYPWINQHIQRTTENRGSLITYPAHVIQEINALHRARKDEQEKTGHDPGVARLAQCTGFDLDKVNRLRRLTNITLSMDYPDSEDVELKLAGSIADPDSDRAQRLAENSSLKRLLWQHLSTLEEREREVICGRWGLDGRPRRTFAQLADQLHVSREWVRQLEKSALEKLGGDPLLSEAYAISQTPG